MTFQGPSVPLTEEKETKVKVFGGYLSPCNCAYDPQKEEKKINKFKPLLHRVNRADEETQVIGGWRGRYKSLGEIPPEERSL